MSVSFHVSDGRKRAIQIVRRGIAELDKHKAIWRLGNLCSFTESEHAQLKTFHSLIEGYIKLNAPPRPLCLAVFGPPGSGKSHIVREICAMLEKEHFAIKLPLTEVNLTELGNTTELVRVVRHVRVTSDGNSIPVIFFDEFDAPLAGIPLGWLSRFLAPMQDGTLVDEGERFELKRAIYIFAGGTADRMADFGTKSGIAFKEAKGPDFVSRLRGYIDVKGPNDATATFLRRAVLIRSALEEAGRTLTGNKSTPPRKISARLLDAMLDVGRYRHGSRSIKAIIEMAAASTDHSGHLDLLDLPPDHILSVHRDLGPLDPAVINGLVGLSAGPQRSLAKIKAKKKPVPRGWSKVVVDLACELWKLGAVIGYGGKWDENGLTVELLQQLTKRAQSLVKATSRLTPSPNAPVEARVEVFARDKPATRVPPRSGMLTVPVPGNWPNTGDAVLMRAATSFRMRWTMTSRCVARIVISGKTLGFSGRMPGVLEETMLALSFRQPLYIIGGFGGAAQVVGELLGLAEKWPSTHRSVGSFGTAGGIDPTMDLAMASAPHVFRPAGFPSLPLTFAEALSFLTGYSMGGAGWPPNGITMSENRELFQTRRAGRIIELVIRGLTRRFHV